MDGGDQNDNDGPATSLGPPADNQAGDARCDHEKQTSIEEPVRIGQELTDQEIEVLRRRDASERAYENALRYLSYRPRSEYEMQRYLQRRGADDGTTKEVIDRLRRARLVNDVEFARFWLENREAYRPRGRWALRAELRQKGVANEIIDLVLRDLDEETSAMKAAERRAQRLARLDEQTFRRRLLGFLRRRGFDYEISRRTANRLWHQVGTAEGPDRD